jgi:hypothetical protein
MANEYLIPIGTDLGPFIADLREARGEVVKMSDVVDKSAKVTKEGFQDAAKANQLYVDSLAENVIVNKNLLKINQEVVDSEKKKKTTNDDSAKSQSSLNKELEKSILIGEKQLSGLKEGSKEYKKLQKELEAAKTGYNILNGALDANANKAEKLKKTYRENVSVLQSLAAQGLQNTKVYKELEKVTGELDDTIRDTNEAIKLVGSDTRGIDNILGSAQAITGAFAVAQGAVAIFGKENENLEKALLKVNAALSILNGLQAIQTELKRKDSFVSRAAAAGQALFATVVGTSTGALKALRIALAATGIGLLVIGLGLLVQNFDKVKEKVLSLFPGLGTLANLVGGLVEKFTDFVGLTSEAQRNLDALTKGNDNLNKSIDRAIAILDARGGKEEEVFKLTKQRIENELDLLKKSEQVKGQLSKEELQRREELQMNLDVLFVTESKRRDDAIAEEQKKNEEANKQRQQKAKENAAKLLEIDKQFREKLLEFDKQFRALKIAAIEDDYQQTVALENQRFDELVAAANQQVESFKGSAEQRAQLQSAANQVIEAASVEHFQNLAAIEKQYYDDRAEQIKNATDLANEVLLSGLDKSLNDVNEKYSKSIADLEKRLTDSGGSDLAAFEALNKLKLAKTVETNRALSESREEQAKRNADSLKKEEKEFESFAQRVDSLAKKLFEQSGLSGSEAEAVVGQFKQLYGSILSAVNESVDAQIEAKQRQIDALTTQIDEAQSELEREQELQEKGYSNNVEAKKAEVAELKKQREKALEDEKRIQVQRAKLQSIEIAQATIAQTVDLGSAAAKIFKATAGIPVVGVALALAAVATMFAGFLAIKSKIKAAQESVPKFRTGGAFDALKNQPSHESGGVGLYNERTGMKVAEFEGDEKLFVVNKGSSKKHEALLRAINKDDFSSLGEGNGSIGQLLRESRKNSMIENAPSGIIVIQKEASGIKIANAASLAGIKSAKQLEELIDELKEFKKQQKERPIVIPHKDFVEVREGNHVKRYWPKKEN